MRWLNQIPLLRLVIPFCIGIMFSFYHPTPFNWLQFILVSSGVILLLTISQLKKIRTSYSLRWVFGVSITLVFGLLGYLLANSKIEKFNSSHYSNDSYSELKGIVVSEVEEKSNSIKTVLEIVESHSVNGWRPSQGKIITYFKKDSSLTLRYGDVIILKKQPSQISPPSNFDEFNYKRYLSHHHIHDQLYLQKHQYKIIGYHPLSIPKSIAINWRNKLLERYTKFEIKNEELAIISALTLGKKENLSPQLKSAYASAGAMHVLAVSGLHVGIIYLILQLVLNSLNRFKYGPQIRSVILIIAIWVYAFITGLSPSVMRAATMFTFMVIAVVFKRNSNIYNTLALSAFVILVFKPYMLLEVGFQLSYLAVFGIIYLHSYLYNLLTFKPWLLNKAWEITCVSIAAQIATAPLGILYFHQFPTYFLFSNLIVIPAAFFIIFTAVSFQIFWFIPWVGKGLSWLLLHIVYTLNYVVKWIDQLPHSLISGLDISVLETWIVYLIFGFLSIWLIQRKSRFFIYALFFIMTLVSSQTIEKWQQLNQSEITFYATGKESLIEFTNGYKYKWIADSLLLNNNEKMLFHVHHHSWKRGLNTSIIDTLKNVISRKNALFLGDISILSVTPTHPLKAKQIKLLNPNIVFINTYKKLDLNEADSNLLGRLFIIGSGSSKKVTQQIISICDSLQLPYYSIKKDGAIKVKLDKHQKKITQISHQILH